MQAPATTYGPSSRSPRVAVYVPGGWARQSAERAVRSSGGTPILLSALTDIPRLSDVCVGAVCDLAPWNEVAIDEFRQVRRAAPFELFILYVPEAVWGLAEPLDEGDPSVRRCVQDPSPEAVAGLESALAWLIESGASSSLIWMILDGRPPANATSMRFLWWAIRAVAYKRQAPVTEAAAELRVATRTLARRLNQCGLPPPVQLFGWIKLLAIAWTAQRTQTSLGKAARLFHLDSMGLFALKSRLLDRDLLPQIRGSANPMPLIVQAFRDRCREIDCRMDSPDVLHLM